jgi:hypothetical protein
LYRNETDIPTLTGHLSCRELPHAAVDATTRLKILRQNFEKSKNFQHIWQS